MWGSHIHIRDSAPRFRRNFAARRYLVQERRISQLKHPCTLSRLWVNWEEIDWKSHETSAFYIHRWIPQKSLFAVFQTSESISCWLKPKVHDFHDWKIVWRVLQFDHENNRFVCGSERVWFIPGFETVQKTFPHSEFDTFASRVYFLGKDVSVNVCFS